MSFSGTAASVQAIPEIAWRCAAYNNQHSWGLLTSHFRARGCDQTAGASSPTSSVEQCNDIHSTQLDAQLRPGGWIREASTQRLDTTDSPAFAATIRCHAPRHIPSQRAPLPVPRAERPAYTTCVYNRSWCCKGLAKLQPLVPKVAGWLQPDLLFAGPGSGSGPKLRTRPVDRPGRSALCSGGPVHLSQPGSHGDCFEFALT